jgi:hypothetical protein
MSKLGNCPNCQGIGYFLEHDPTDPHYDGMCQSCPVQCPCTTCNSTGWIRSMKKIMLEKIVFPKIIINFEEMDDLPF